MEQKSIWKNILLLTVGSLLALHLNVSNAADSAPSDSSEVKTEGCVLTD